MVFSFGVFASSEPEKVELRRVTTELRFLIEEVKEISRLRREDDPEPFGYEGFVQDLEEVTKAAERHLNSPSRQPRQLKPLVLDY